MIDITIPASKSLTHRAFLLAALSNEPCAVYHPLMAEDTRTTLLCLRALGAKFEERTDGVFFTPMNGMTSSDSVLDCGNSGTTLRLLLAQAARLNGESHFTGDPSLCRRPNRGLIDALVDRGAQWDGLTEFLPGTIRGPITPGHYVVDATRSSQYVTGLLLSLPFLAGNSTLRLIGQSVSRPYIDLTLQMMAHFGLRIEEQQDDQGTQFRVPGLQRPCASQIRIEGDWSTAAFPFIASVLSGRDLRLRGLSQTSKQGDRRLLEVLSAFGQTVDWPKGAGYAQLKPAGLRAMAALNLGDTPDMFPAVAMLAAASPGRTQLTGAAHLRHKESDRIALVVEGLRRLGVTAEERQDGAVIEGGPVVSGIVDSGGDHRILMAFECLSLLSTGAITVQGRGAESVSYPSFYSDLAKFR